MARQANNLREAKDLDLFFKVRKRGVLRIYDDPDIALWQKIFYFILLEVEFNEGYVSCLVATKIAKYFNISEKYARTAISRLVSKGWLLKYPYGAKRAKGYMLHPDLVWFGDEESSKQKVNIYYKSINKLQIEVDAQDLEEVDIKVKNLSKNAEIIHS